MSRDIWNPRQYRAYASHRARPFYELLARVDMESPAYVVDLGCGPGERTADLAVRWPAAVIEGIDSSAQMIAEARRTTAGRTSGSKGRTSSNERTTEGVDPSAGMAADAPFANAEGTSGSRGSTSPGDEDAAEGDDPSARMFAGGRSATAARTSGLRGRTSPGDERVADGVDPSACTVADGRPATAASFSGSRGRTSPEDERAAEGVDPSARTAERTSGPKGSLPPEGEAATEGDPAAGEGKAPLNPSEVLEASPGAPVAEEAGVSRDGELRFSVGDIAAWMPDRPVDVIFSNAAFQWVPEHRELLPRWVEALAPGGRLAFSMPGNFDAPSHRILRQLCESPRWHDRLATVNRHNVVGDPAEYFELLSDLGCEVDAWETTYVQVLHGPDPVLEWMKGTALRPAFDALPDEAEREEFVNELTALLREAYPAGPHGTLFPFRRIFVIAGPAKSAPAPS